MLKTMHLSSVPRIYRAMRLKDGVALSWALGDFWFNATEYLLATANPTRDTLDAVEILLNTVKPCTQDS